MCAAVLLDLCGPKSHARYFTFFPVGKLVLNYARSPGRRASQKKNCARTVVVFTPDACNWAQTARFHFCRRYRRLNTTLIFHFVSTPFTFLLLSVGPKYIAPSLTVDLMDQVRYGESIDSVCAWGRGVCWVLLVPCELRCGLAGWLAVC